VSCAACGRCRRRRREVPAGRGRRAVRWKFDESRLDIFRIVAQGGIFCHFELGEKAIEKPLVLKDHWDRSLSWVFRSFESVGKGRAGRLAALIGVEDHGQRGDLVLKGGAGPRENSLLLLWGSRHRALRRSETVRCFSHLRNRARRACK
jgi:hypothetical protein